MSKELRFFNASDPLAPQELWHYVYFHGAAEDLSENVRLERNWPWCAGDLVCCDGPNPVAEGDYRGTLYGVPVVAVVRRRHGLLGGRVALDDPESAGYEHCFSPQDWM